MPAVSIVVPVYNVEKYLRECLDSVVRQTLEDIEVVCVDDGSTDGSAAILAEYAAKDRRIRVLSQPNGGLGAARNAGMDAASGKYVYFLDSDDWLADCAMARCVEICERDGLDQLVFGTDFLFEDPSMDEAERLRRSRYYQIPEEFAGGVWSGRDLLARLPPIKRYCVSVPLRMYNLGVLRSANVRFAEGVLHEDVLFTAVSLMVASRVGMTAERLYVRRYRAGSIVTEGGVDADVRRAVSRLRIYRMLLEEFASRGLAASDPGLVADFMKFERSRLVNMMTTPVALRTARAFPALTASLWLHRLARRIAAQIRRLK